ncbi:MAG: hypothetical protein ABMB14_12065, partial [Myxococcota bacterium]
VGAADLRAWTVSAGDLRATVATRSDAAVAGAELVPIAGMNASYLRLVDADGWAAAGALRPELVAARLGGGAIRVAVPAQSVLVAWRVGDPAIDTVMAVGVRELFEQQPGPVSPKIHTWDAGRWTPFGEAVPKEPVAAPVPSPPAPR